MERTKFICTNWACGRTFVKSENNDKACVHHRGVWQFASYHV